MTFNSFLKNTTFNISENIKTTITVTLAIVSTVLLLFSLRQDKENAKKKLVLAGVYVLITLVISFFFLYFN
jgi:Ca2+/Na+ antiporter